MPVTAAFEPVTRDLPPSLDGMPERLCAILRGDDPGRPGAGTEVEIATLVRAAGSHGLLPLIFESLGTRVNPSAAEGAMLRAMEEIARTEAAVDVIRVATCRDVLAALDAAAIEVLVFKGGALAHTHYRRSDLRPRDDTDLLVRECDRDRAREVLARLGFTRVPAIQAKLASYQSLHALTDSRGIRHNIDLHWQVSNRQRYAAALGVDDLFERTAALAALGDRARCLDPVHATLVASLHRAAHRGTQRLVWVYDIHLLVGALDAAERVELAERARETGLARECAEALALARRGFSTFVPAQIEPLVAEFFPGSGSATVRSVNAEMRGPRTIDIWMTDLAALRSWRARLALLRDHAFPAPEHMLRRARVHNPLWLPVLYLSRAMRGIPGLFRRD